VDLACKNEIPIDARYFPDLCLSDLIGRWSR
jgi:hypothetical protein